MRFTKLHGCGNDYLFVDCIAQPPPADPENLSRRISDRHFGVGSDGLILLLPSGVADARMRMFNADGSEGAMCGNGIRCLAKFAFERGLVRANPMRIETGRGVLTVEMHLTGGRVESATVDMDEPMFDPPRIPVTLAGDRIVERVVEQFPLLPPMTCVSMGSAHAVFFCDDVEAFDLAGVGPRVENAEIFPQRVNVNVAQVISPREIRMRTWEKGSGLTLACGTGACATVVAGVTTGRLDRDVRVHVPGGELRIEWRLANNRVYMTGPAVEVFSGDW